VNTPRESGIINGMNTRTPPPPILSQRAWIDLRSVAHAYALPFHTRQPKQVVYDRLRFSLADGKLIRRQLRRMPTPARAALDALQDAGGHMPLPEFTERFGTVRIWRAWRPYIPYRPWQRPESPAEWLWHFGLIEFVDGTAVIPQEILNILPIRPKPVIEPVAPLESRVAQVLVGLAHLVGYLTIKTVRPMPGGWLPPRVWRFIGERLNAPELLSVRSEKSSDLARLIHYTAESAGWIAAIDGVLRPTSKAWEGLSLPPSQAADHLLNAVRGDVKSGLARWKRFDWPLIRRHHYAHAPWVLGLRPHPLAPSGEGGFIPRFSLTLSPQSTHFGEITAFALTPSPLEGEGAGGEGLFALAALSGLGRWENGALWFDRDVIRQAVGLGMSAAELAGHLSDLTGQPIPSAVRTQLEVWESQAVRVKVEHTAVLTVTDSADLAALRSDWRSRRLLGADISPHHAVISAAHLPDLLKMLSRRGLTPLYSPPIEPAPSLERDLIEYAYLGVRISQRLGRLLPAGMVTLPAFVRQSLAADIGHPRADELDSLAKHAIEALQHRIRRRIWLNDQDGEI
jgi:hypothetical protein